MRKRLFSEQPTDIEIAEYGELFAYAIAQVNSEKKRSRVMSAVTAITMGSIFTAVNALEGDLSEPKTIGFYAVPIIINGISQLRTEQVNRRQIQRLEKIGQIASQESNGLREMLANEDIPIPELFQPNQLKNIFESDAQ